MSRSCILILALVTTVSSLSCYVGVDGDVSVYDGFKACAFKAYPEGTMASQGVTNLEENAVDVGNSDALASCGFEVAAKDKYTVSCRCYTDNCNDEPSAREMMRRLLPFDSLVSFSAHVSKDSPPHHSMWSSIFPQTEE